MILDVSLKTRDNRRAISKTRGPCSRCAQTGVAKPPRPYNFGKQPRGALDRDYGTAPADLARSSSTAAGSDGHGFEDLA